MAKKKKGIQTPEWLKQGYDSPEAYKKAVGTEASKGSESKDLGKKESKSDKKNTKSKTSSKKSGKTFKIRKCPSCSSDDVAVVVGEDKKDEWKCNKCGWQGKNIIKEELSEEELLKYLDELESKIEKRGY